MPLTNATCILGLMLAAQAGSLSVSELLANAERFNGQPVTVTGTVSNVRGIPFRRGGPVYTFDLSDRKETVHVTAFAKPPCQSGVVTVEGTFEEVKRRVKVRYAFEEITARTVTCLPERGPATK